MSLSKDFRERIQTGAASSIRLSPQREAPEPPFSPGVGRLLEAGSRSDREIRPLSGVVEDRTGLPGRQYVGRDAPQVQGRVSGADRGGRQRLPGSRPIRRSRNGHDSPARVVRRRSFQPAATDDRGISAWGVRGLCAPRTDRHGRDESRRQGVATRTQSRGCPQADARRTILFSRGVTSIPHRG